MNVAIIGGGPAGLRAAEVAAAGGASVTLFDAKPSVGRKFLVAGCGGLNLTRAESSDRFATRYSGSEMPQDVWPSLLADFDPNALRAWAAGLGIETFASSSGRVYPVGLRAARLLLRWVTRLRSRGVRIQTRHRWTGLTIRENPRKLQLDFATDQGAAVTFDADAVVLALGGGSWPRTGSDGGWTGILERMAIAVTPLEPANSGWELPWADSVLSQAEGRPIKNIVARAGEQEAAGELLITRYGLEGSALYALGPALRTLKRERGTAELRIDFKPSFTAEELLAKLGPVKNPAKLLDEARTRWRLSDAAFAILVSRGPFPTAAALAAETKNCRLFLTEPRPLAEAISSAGGVRWSELTRGLMLRRLPGVFLAGEMIDWESPTGGYLLQGCMATGTRAGNRALEWLRSAQ
ncbi:MAG: TIGR03862 family flavoprotein [Verrucomicrobia bacterium]|nr:TIGR03862 family flavoprotein [Verrucomicrobiota bacterium]